MPVSCLFYCGIALFRRACSTPRVPRKPHPLTIFTAPTYLTLGYTPSFHLHFHFPSTTPLPVPSPSSPGLWLFSRLFYPFPSLKPQPASTQAVVVVCVSFYSFVTTLILLSICAYCALFSFLLYFFVSFFFHYYFRFVQRIIISAFDFLLLCHFDSYIRHKR